MSPRRPHRTAAAVPACPACHRPRHGDDGCDGMQVNAWRYGDEPHWTDMAERDLIPKQRCVDCSTPVGGHHHANCLQARCMECDDQAVCCPHARDNAYIIE